MTFLFAACLDGALHMWQASSNFVRPNMTVEAAHAKSTETASIVFSVDGRTVLTRGGDDTVKRTYTSLGGPASPETQLQCGISVPSKNLW